MGEQIIEDSVNNYTSMSMYDYLDLSITSGYQYILAGLITPRQRVFNIAKKGLNDDYLMIEDMADEIYQGKKQGAFLDDDCIKLFSEGKNLSVELPDEISFEQFLSLQDVLRQIRSFAYDYDREIFLPVSTREIMAEAKNIISEEEKTPMEENIIGTPLVKEQRKII